MVYSLRLDRGTQDNRMIPIAQPLIGEVEVAAASEVIRSGWRMQGERVAAFEAAFAACVNAEHACAVASGSVALHLALLALGVQPGDEVITANPTFLAGAKTIQQIGATPVMVDIEHGNMTMDPVQVEEAITARTRAVLCVHAMGMPCDLGRILPIARAHGLPVVEDASCALGSEILFNGQWEAVGRPHGDIACFSLLPQSVISAGDGGVLTTKDAALDTKLRTLFQHGMCLPEAVPCGYGQTPFRPYILPSFDYRLTGVEAAIGTEQLRRLADIVQQRRERAAYYDSLIAAEIPCVALPQEAPWAWSNWQSYCVWLPPGTNQHLIMQRMWDSGVVTRPGVVCPHREEARTGMRLLPRLPESETAQDRCLLLPLYPELTPEMQEKVVVTLRQAGRW